MQRHNKDAAQKRSPGSSNDEEEELLQREGQELSQLQEAVCSPNLLTNLFSITILCIKGRCSGSETRDSATDIGQLCDDVAVAALNACAAIVCGSASNQSTLTSVGMVIPWGPKRMVTRVGALAQIVHMCMDTTTRRSSPAIRSAALGLFDAYLCLNDSGSISFVGHAIAPPPADLSSLRVSIFQLAACGRIVIQEIVASLHKATQLLAGGTLVRILRLHHAPCLPNL